MTPAGLHPTAPLPEGLPDTLPEDETQALAARASQGDVDARNRLISGNLRLVWALALRYAGRGVDLGDVFQSGCTGLIQAVDNYDPARGAGLATYAVPFILGQIRHYLRSLAPVKVSRDARRAARRVLESADRLRTSLGREPTLVEVSEAAGLSPEEVVFVLERVTPALRAPSGLDSGPHDLGSGQAPRADSCFSTDSVRPQELRELEDMVVDNVAMKQALSSLDPRLREVVLMRFAAGRTQVEVAAAMGLSQPQVSRLQRQALRALRAALDPSDPSPVMTQSATLRPY